jgi:hypothetical protein
VTTGPDQRAAWLRQAMQLILADLGDQATPLVVTVIAAREGRLDQITITARRPGRLYRQVIDPAETTRPPAGH